MSLFIAIILFLAIYPPLHTNAQAKKVAKDHKNFIERVISSLKHKSDSITKANAIKIDSLDQSTKEFDSLKIIIKKRKNGSK